MNTQPQPPIETQIMTRIVGIEDILINLIHPIQLVTQLLRSESFKTLVDTIRHAEKSMTWILDQNLNRLNETIEENRQSLAKIDIIQALAEIKYLGNRLKKIEEDIAKIKDDGVKRSITCKIDIEGMEDNSKVKEQPHNNDIVNEIISTLSPREKQVIILRCGLYLGKIHIYKEIGARFGITAQRARDVYNKALRKLRRGNLAHQYKKISRKDNEFLFKSIFPGNSYQEYMKKYGH